MTLTPLEDRDEVEINVKQLPLCIDSWHSSEEEGYRLFIVEELTRGASDSYVLTKYDKETGDVWDDIICSMGRVSYNSFDIAHVPVFDGVDGVSEFSDEQWATVEKAYSQLCQTEFENTIFEGIPNLYKNVVYSSLSEFGETLRGYVTRVHSNIERCEESEGSAKEHYEEYEGLEKLSDEQLENIGVVADAVESPEVSIDLDEYTVGVVLEFDMFDAWEVRALEHLHKGVFVNKSELAKTKALLEDGCSQAEIADVLGKDASTVSRQVSSVERLEMRAEWTVRQGQ